MKVVELFAGVGGFRVGLERLEKEGINFETVFASQWEPSKVNQFAYNCYNNHFKDTNSINSNEDISTVDVNDIPPHDLLVGGFPCQDYSVASTGAKGIQGKKGVLWWEIYRILKHHKTPYALLENVDRLLKSPTAQRGRDFAIMLKCLDDLGYDVEWRVINAAEYGHAQRRRRVFIFASKRMVNNVKTKYSKRITHLNKYNDENAINLVQEKGFFNNLFPSELDIKKVKEIVRIDLKSEEEGFYTKDFENDIQKISDEFNTMFRNSGIMKNGKILSYDVISTYKGNPVTLDEILEQNEIDEEYFVTGEQDMRMKQAKGGKKIERTAATGHKYTYSEGSMSYPEDTSLPGRTMLTSEGTINRSTHVVIDKQTNKKRFITPVEAERLNEFPDNWTEGMTKRQRFFCMGNALVTGLITTMGREIDKINNLEEK